MGRLSARIPDDMLEKVDKLAKQLEIDRTDVVREALNNLFDGKSISDASLLMLGRRLKKWFIENGGKRST